MKTLRAVLTATAVPLLLASLPVLAGELHWSASIGTGLASSTDATASPHGVPATPHWTARIGTGSAASGATAIENKELASAKKGAAVADAHWTSRIGTGHATELNVRGHT